MKRTPISAEQFIKVWQETNGVPSEVARILNYASLITVSKRRLTIERERGITLHSSSVHSSRNAKVRRKNSRRIEIELKDGVIVIGSDAHLWPGPLTTAQRGIIKVVGQIKPDIVVMNGDVFDGARISRFPAGIWDQEKRPNVAQELEACETFLTALQKASSAQRYWTIGNHDARFEMRLASLVPEYEGVPGFALKDRFPEWSFAMALFVNDNLVIKHRLKGGQHATHNNALAAGRSIVTGHLHNPKYSPITDYNGTRYGVDGGTLADPESRQFDYVEEAPCSWRGSFAVVTIKDGRVMLPELCQVWDENHVEFRGEVIPA